MTAPPDPLGARWRRLDAALERVRAASTSSETEMPDAIVATLDALYRLWEAWASSVVLTSSLSRFT